MAIFFGSCRLEGIAPIVVAASLLACCGMPQTVSASNVTVPTELGSGVTLEIDKPLSDAPPTGLFPMLVKVHNGGSSSGSWTVSTGVLYGRGGVATETPISVGPGKSAAVWIYAPVGANDYGGYRQFQVTIRGSGITGMGGAWNTILSHSTSPSALAAEIEYPGFSTKVARKGEIAMQDRYKKDHGGAEMDFTKVDLEQDIGDWRSLSGLGQLWLTDEEWSGTDANTRATLMDWLTQGGRLVMLCSDISPDRLATLKIPAADYRGNRRVGAGRVVALRWDGVSFPVEQSMTLLKEHDDGDPLPRLLANYHNQWSLPSAVGIFAVHGWLIFFFILTFGLLVGPVNLFYFAGAQRRHRMFWTTPVISLAGGAVLLMVMLFQDGVGGSGARRILAILNPAQKKTALVQEQVSRTGVLLGTSFAIPEPVWLDQIALADTSMSYAETTNRRNMESGEWRTGDWFASRDRQAHLLQTVRPSRGGVEYYPGADAQTAPAVISSLAAPLSEVFIVDENGGVWTAHDVATGVKKSMTQSSPGDLDAWLRHIWDDELGPVGKNRLQRIRAQRAQVFAVSRDADSFAVPTLKSIRWSNQTVIFAGPYEKH
jgi:hypothetical protein